MSRKRNRPYNPSRALKTYWQTEAYQETLYQNFRDDIMSLALSRFKWVNLPRSCDPRYLELTLLYQGMASIAYPKNAPGMFTALKATIQGEPNMYGMPKRWIAEGETGKTRFPCDWANGVLVLDSRTMYPLMSKINVWARELADIHITQLINDMHMRMPMAITAPKEKVFDVQNFYKQIQTGDPFTLGYDSFSDIDVSMTFQNKRNEYVNDLLDEHCKNKWEEIYKSLGIKNLPYKAERFIEDEVSVTAQPAELSAMSPLDMRREACRKLNERFGAYLKAPVSVIWNSDLATSNYNATHDLVKLMEDDDENDV